MKSPETDMRQAENVDAFLASENSRRVFASATLIQIFALLDDVETMATMTYRNWFEKPSRLGAVK